MKDRSKVLLSNISQETTEQLIRDLFDRTPGVVLSVSICMDAKTKVSKGCAFVEMETDSQAYHAVRDLNGLSMDGRAVTISMVNKAEPKRKWYKLGAR